jgi:phosphate-selective porin OprO/OprP
MSRIQLFGRARALAVGVAAVLLLAGGVAFAQQYPAPPPNPNPVALQTSPLVTPGPANGQYAPPGGPAPVAYPQEGAMQMIDRKAIEAMVDARFKEKVKEEADKKKADDEKKKADDEAKKAQQDAEGYVVGSLLDVKASFTKDGYLWLKTPNEDFTMHIGYWMQYDNVWWTQSPLLRTPQDGRPGNKQGVASGAPLGGIGDLEDGTYFRRIRPFLEGTFWEVGEYRLILALENVQFGLTGLDEFWVGLNKIPVIGTVRFGHVKTPMGLEADMTASSRCMTFLERSSYSEAIELNQNFVTGVWLGNNYFDQRATYTFALFRPDQGASSGTFFGDGQWGWQGRLTALPLYECEGRHLLHLGLSGGYRNGTNDLSVSTDRTFRLRARPELRDDDAAAGGTSQLVPDANSNRMVDTGAIAASRQWLMGLELLYIAGPLSLQAEYGFNWIDNAIGIAPTGFTLNPKITPPQNYFFNGGYVQLAYTLTGENRAYDRAIGTLARTYFNGGPFSNAWLLWDREGGLNWSVGAWEIAARYSYINLNDGTGLNRIQGGVMNGWTLGLNWYVNSNIKFQFDWVYDQRSAVPVGTIPGYTSGFGTRVQLSF